MFLFHTGIDWIPFLEKIKPGEGFKDVIKKKVFNNGKIKKVEVSLEFRF